MCLSWDGVDTHLPMLSRFQLLTNTFIRFRVHTHTHTHIYIYIYENAQILKKQKVFRG